MSVMPPSRSLPSMSTEKLDRWRRRSKAEVEDETGLPAAPAGRQRWAYTQGRPPRLGERAQAVLAGDQDRAAHEQGEDSDTHGDGAVDELEAVIAVFVSNPWSPSNEDAAAPVTSTPAPTISVTRLAAIRRRRWTRACSRAPTAASKDGVALDAGSATAWSRVGTHTPASPQRSSDAQAEHGLLGALGGTKTRQCCRRGRAGRQQEQRK